MALARQPYIRVSDRPRGLIPHTGRGEDRRKGVRMDGSDWRINEREYSFLGATFDPLTFEQTLARAAWMSPEHEFRYIVTPNVDHVIRLNKERHLYERLYDGSWLSVCDSRVIELLAKVVGLPLHAVPGSDLTEAIFKRILQPGDVVNVIGGDAPMIDELRVRYPDFTINHHEPPMGLAKKPAAIAHAAIFVDEHPARFTFICVGSPQQELVAEACTKLDTTVGLGLCVGASIEFLTGRRRRAPKFMRWLRLEWLFRLCAEPRRMWRRYLIKGPIIFFYWFRWTFYKDSESF